MFRQCYQHFDYVLEKQLVLTIFIQGLNRL